MAKAVDTRRAYIFQMYAPMSKFVCRYRTMRQLTRFIERVSDEEKIRVPGIGRSLDSTSFYCTESHAIYFTKNQQCYDIALHELTHAAGFWDHDVAFMRRYIGLLVKYGKCEMVPLVIMAGMLGYKL